MRLLTASVLVASLVVSGCATLEQAQMKQAYQADLGAARAGCSEQLKTAAIDPLRGKIVIDVGQVPTLPMLSDSAHPSQQERDALAVLDPIHSACNGGVISVLTRHFPPEYAALGNEVASALRANRAELYAGRISYGEYNQMEQAVNAALQSRLQQLDAKYQAMAQQQQAIKDQQLINSLGALNMLNQAAMPRAPVNTTCSQLGNFVNCTTR